MKKLILTTLLFHAFSALCSSLPQTKAEFCARFGDLETIQELSTEPANLMAFKNDGGLFDGGVCWWHSRFQRNIFYLSLFRPDLNKPKNISDIQKIIHQIRLGASVVIIPGYSTLEDFSKENQKLIQRELNDWQIYDGVVLGRWIEGLKGNTSTRPWVLEQMMNDVFQYVAIKKKIAYEKLQIKGITSHAWLVVGMSLGPNGYEVGYIDSNSPRMSLNYSYKKGDSSFFIKGYGNFVPYLEFVREEERLVDTGKVFCGLKKRSLATDQEIKENYDLDLKEAMEAGRKF